MTKSEKRKNNNKLKKTAFPFYNFNFTYANKKRFLPFQFKLSYRAICSVKMWMLNFFTISSIAGNYELHVNFNGTAVIYVNRIFTSAFVIRGNSHIYYKFEIKYLPVNF
ncbi:hypothetical protein T10_209 [Trichinella papuae]|uniref:Uncharacterized protein n=1 Tax=Trichinella papuae TaxID=268474 RepID=A0A0V1MF41_9BILA|nr:hypothetical protein T10_209 [Trichinella papuae]